MADCLVVLIDIVLAFGFSRNYFKTVYLDSPLVPIDIEIMTLCHLRLSSTKYICSCSDLFY